MKNKGIVAIVIILSVILMGLVGAVVYMNSDPVKVKKQIDLGNKYLDNLEYDEAIAAFNIAIDIDPMNAEAYYGLAKVYMETGDSEKALEVLEKGFKKTEDEKLEKTIARLKKKIEKEEQEKREAEEKAKREAEEKARKEAEEKARREAEEKERERQEKLANIGTGFEIGERFPNFIMKDENGRDVSLESYRGKVLYMNYFTTWCPYCFYELPDMQSIKEKYGDDIEIVLIDLGETVQEAQAYQADYGIDFTINHLPSWNVGGYQVQGVPESVILDADGIIIDRCEGMSNYNWMESAIDRALVGYVQ